MPNLKIASILMLGTFLGACASTTPAPTVPVIPAGAIGNATANTDGTYTVTANSTSYDLGTPTIAGGNTNRFFGFLPDARARGFSNADVIAIGGLLGDGTGIAGLTGTASAPAQTSGTATYAARYTMVYTTASGAPVIAGTDGATTISVDFSAGTLSAGSPYLTFTNTNISGATFTGDVTCSYTVNGCTGTSPMQGGFYGTNGIAGVYAGTNFAGAFYGTKNP